MRHSLRAAIYFLLVFATGFVLGVIRVLLIVPRLGERWAELLELPLMLVAVFLSARWINRRLISPNESIPRTYLIYGVLAFFVLVCFEFLLAFLLRHQTPWQAIATRDPLAASAYYFSLLLFALMPWLLRPRPIAPPPSTPDWSPP